MGALKAGCERAREWISLGLDNELSELESAQLDAHLGRCAACAAYAARVRVATEELRAAPQVPADVTVLVARRRRRAAMRSLVASAAIIGAVAVGGLTGSLRSDVTSAHAAKPPYFEQRLLTIARHTHGGVIISS